MIVLAGLPLVQVGIFKISSMWAAIVCWALTNRSGKIVIPASLLCIVESYESQKEFQSVSLPKNFGNSNFGSFGKLDTKCPAGVVDTFAVAPPAMRQDCLIYAN